MSQKSEDFLKSHVRMFEFFGGVPAVASPANLKSAVTKSHRYEPELNPANTRLAEHYNIGIVPAQVRSPKHKAVVERTIQIVQCGFFATVRQRTFTILAELNACLRDHITVFNNKTDHIFRRSRTNMCNTHKNSLQPMSKHPYEVVIHHRARVHPDCHLAFEKNFLSVSESLRGKLLDVWSGEKLSISSKKVGTLPYISAARAKGCP